jgi:hypothetical protein
LQLLLENLVTVLRDEVGNERVQKMRLQKHYDKQETQQLQHMKK